MTNQTVLEIAATSKRAFKCSHSVLLFTGSSYLDLNNFRVIAFVNLNSDEFPANIGMILYLNIFHFIQYHFYLYCSFNH